METSPSPQPLQSADPLDRSLFEPNPQRKPNPPRTGQPQPRELDAEDLSRQPMRELAPAGAAEEEEPLAAVAREMREAQRRIARSESGRRTQAVQQQVVAELDRLVQQARTPGSSRRPNRGRHRRPSAGRSCSRRRLSPRAPSPLRRGAARPASDRPPGHRRKRPAWPRSVACWKMSGANFPTSSGSRCCRRRSRSFFRSMNRCWKTIFNVWRRRRRRIGHDAKDPPIADLRIPFVGWHAVMRRSRGSACRRAPGTCPPDATRRVGMPLSHDCDVVRSLRLPRVVPPRKTIRSGPRRTGHAGRRPGHRPGAGLAGSSAA